MFERFINQTANVQQMTIGKDSGGGATRTPSTILSNIAVGIQPARSHTTDIFSRRNIVVDYEIYSLYDFAANISGGLTLAHQFVSGGNTYKVQGGVRPLVKDNIKLYVIAAQLIVS